MKAIAYYKEFLKKEASGDYHKAWTDLLAALYLKKDKDYKKLIEQVYTRDWLDQRYLYMNLNNQEWQLTVACIFDDAYSREDGIFCYLAWHILNRNYRWYNVCSSFSCMNKINNTYSDWEVLKDAIEKKAKLLGFDVHK